MIACDAAKVERIVENLLGNTVKHTPPDARIWVRVVPWEGGALIVVEDDGPGVPAEQREKIFEPFLQGETASPASVGRRRGARARGAIRGAPRRRRVGRGTPGRRRVVPGVPARRSPAGYRPEPHADGRPRGGGHGQLTQPGRRPTRNSSSEDASQA